MSTLNVLQTNPRPRPTRHLTPTVPPRRPMALHELPPGTTPADQLRRLVMDCCSWRDLLELRRNHPDCFELVAPVVLEAIAPDDDAAEAS